MSLGRSPSRCLPHPSLSPSALSPRLPISKWHCILYGRRTPLGFSLSGSQNKTAHASSANFIRKKTRRLSTSPLTDSFQRRRLARVSYMATRPPGGRERRCGGDVKESGRPSSSLHDVMRFRDKGRRRCDRNCRGRRDASPVPCADCADYSWACHFNFPSPDMFLLRGLPTFKLGCQFLCSQRVDNGSREFTQLPNCMRQKGLHARVI